MFVILGLTALLLGLGLINSELKVGGSITLVAIGVVIVSIGIGLIIHTFYDLGWIVTFLEKY